MLNTPLTQLRKAAPGSLTLAKLERILRQKGLPRALGSIGAFERGQYKNPPDAFLLVYAEAIGQSIHTVRRALRLTQRQRESRSGPFGRSRAA